MFLALWFFFIVIGFARTVLGSAFLPNIISHTHSSHKFIAFNNLSYILACVSASDYGLGQARAFCGTLASLSVKHGDLETLKSFLSLNFLSVYGFLSVYDFPAVES